MAASHHPFVHSVVKVVPNVVVHESCFHYIIFSIFEGPMKNVHILFNYSRLVIL